MGKNSKIEWTDHTFSPWWGCHKVSPGCAHCYAEVLSARFGHERFWGLGAKRRFFNDKHWAEPLAWNRQAEKTGQRARVFCGSMCDVFEHDPNMPPAYLGDQRLRLYSLIENTPWLIWMLLTKRPENVLDLTPELWNLPGRWPENVWVGASVENQEWANRRIPELLKVPARVRFLSCEPLLAYIDLGIATPCGYYCDETIGHVDHAFWTPGIEPGISWVIAGGESGPKSRPMHPAWVRNLRDQCVQAGVPFFFKQWGEWNYDPLHIVPSSRIYMDATGQIHKFRGTQEQYEHGRLAFDRVGKKESGRLLDGLEWNQYPEDEL